MTMGGNALDRSLTWRMQQETCLRPDVLLPSACSGLQTTRVATEFVESRGRELFRFPGVDFRHR